MRLPYKNKTLGLSTPILGNTVQPMTTVFMHLLKKHTHTQIMLSQMDCIKKYKELRITLYWQKKVRLKMKDL